VETRIIDRQTLASDTEVTGPAIVEDPDSTTVVLPGDVARISAAGHLIIEVAQESRA
jgi:N-methylhydantoinase A